MEEKLARYLPSDLANIVLEYDYLSVIRKELDKEEFYCYENGHTGIKEGTHSIEYINEYMKTIAHSSYPCIIFYDDGIVKLYCVIELCSMGIYFSCIDHEFDDYSDYSQIYTFKDNIYQTRTSSVQSEDPDRIKELFKLIVEKLNISKE